MTIPTPPVRPAGAQVELRRAGDDHAALAAAIDGWSDSLVSRHTRRAYRRPVDRLLNEHGQITPAALADLRNDLVDEGRSAGTVRQAIAGVLSCVRWMVASGYAPVEVLGPLEAVDRPKHRDDRLPRAPNAAQVEALRTAAPALAFPDQPVRQAYATATVALLAGTGIRVGEAVSVRHRHLRDARPNVQNLAAAQGRRRPGGAAVLEVIDGKGGVSRTVPAPADVPLTLGRLAKVADLRPAPTDPLLPGLEPGAGDARPLADASARTTTRSIARLLAELGDALGYDSGLVRPHALRHAYALGQLDPIQRPDGRPLAIGVLQRRLGHESPSTTAKYLIAAEDPDLA